MDDRVIIVNGATMDSSRIALALAKATTALLEARNAQGAWTGELSSSALSTATAVTALAIFNQATNCNLDAKLIAKGLEWLADHVNADGGWGDTTRSISNLSTTTLCWTAFGAAEWERLKPLLPEGSDERFASVVAAAEAWIGAQAGSTHPDRLAPAIARRYGKDRTFSAPILTMCALAGRLGEGREAWKSVLPLPFELAALPRSWFGALRLPVVSYALPALIAIGQARHFHRPTKNPFTRFARGLTRKRTLRVLEQIQPSNGGFLEATPLTSFVAMSLAGSGQADQVVTRRAIQFLRKSMRPDGSWPIDTNLGTWVTTLSVNALSEPLGNRAHSSPASIFNPKTRSTDESVQDRVLSPEDRYRVQRWILSQQQMQKHSYTDAAPGGWAWTDLPGGVPDADDTAGALLALRNLEWDPQQRMSEGLAEGVKWLLNLQNNDGGTPTFCRGWGALPFDRSSPDLTAHAIRAWLCWLPHCGDLPGLQQPVEKAIGRALSYLLKSRGADGSWLPLWFGNQFAPDDENATYGTARVLPALVETISAPGAQRFLTPKLRGVLSGAISRATQWLLDAQDTEGSWGGCAGAPGSIEETALAVHALARVAAVVSDLHRDELQSALDRGTAWLVERVENGTWIEASPIGFYFAKLWYYEKIYPLAFTVAALRAVSKPSTPQAL